VQPGDLSTSFPIDDADPSKHVPTVEQRNEDPLEYGYYLQDLIARAEPAFEKGDWAGAVKYFEVLGRAEPNIGVSFSRLCVAYAKLGRFDVAAANCGRAVGLPGARVMDHLRFVEYTLQKPKLLPVDVTDADASLAYLRAHLAELPPTAAQTAADAGAPAHPQTLEEAAAAYMQRNSPAAAAARAKKATEPPAPPPLNLPLEIELHACQLATRLSDAKRLAACSARLRAVEADERIVLSYDWSRALVTGDEPRASALLAKAEKLGFPPAAKAAMLAQQQKTFAAKGLLGKLGRGDIGVTAGGGALVLLALGLVAWALAGVRRRKVESESPV
jgi:hypothetical protein